MARDATIDRSIGDVSRSGSTVAHRAADALSLAAAPVFAAMALLTGGAGDGQLDVLCSTTHGLSWLGGMSLMYWLMSAFHLSPWLRRVARLRDSAACSPLRRLVRSFMGSPASRAATLIDAATARAARPRHR